MLESCVRILSEFSFTVYIFLLSSTRRQKEITGKVRKRECYSAKMRCHAEISRNDMKHKEEKALSVSNIYPVD